MWLLIAYSFLSRWKPQIIRPLLDNITFPKCIKWHIKQATWKLLLHFLSMWLPLNVMFIPYLLPFLPFLCNVISLQNVITKLHIVPSSTSILRNAFSLLNAQISPTEKTTNLTYRLTLNLGFIWDLNDLKIKKYYFILSISIYRLPY